MPLSLMSNKNQQSHIWWYFLPYQVSSWARVLSTRVTKGPQIVTSATNAILNVQSQWLLSENERCLLESVVAKTLVSQRVFHGSFHERPSKNDENENMQASNSLQILQQQWTGNTSCDMWMEKKKLGTFELELHSRKIYHRIHRTAAASQILTPHTRAPWWPVSKCHALCSKVDVLQDVAATHPFSHHSSIAFNKYNDNSYWKQISNRKYFKHNVLEIVVFFSYYAFITRPLQTHRDISPAAIFSEPVAGWIHEPHAQKVGSTLHPATVAKWRLL